MEAHCASDVRPAWSAGRHARGATATTVATPQAAGADPHQALDRAAVVHRLVPVDDVVEVGLEVEHEARVDGAGEDVGEQFGDVPAGRGTPPRSPTLRKMTVSRDPTSCGAPTAPTTHAEPAIAKAVVIDSPVPTHSSAASTPRPSVIWSTLDGLIASLRDDVRGAELAGERLAGGLLDSAR